MELYWMDNFPQQVYLSLTKESAKAHKYRGWLCGGVIVDRYYVLTSAACVEDADRFYIVAGTTKFVDSFDYKNNDCVCKHRRKVVWKCIPKSKYKYYVKTWHVSLSINNNTFFRLQIRLPRQYKMVFQRHCNSESRKAIQVWSLRKRLRIWNGSYLL